MLCFQSWSSDRLGDPDEDRPDVTLLKDWSEVSAPVLVLAALAQASQVPGPVRAQAVVPAERLPALVQALARVPELASALAPVQVPGFQPLAARPWELRPCART
jgi:hypothetical protein